MVVRVDTFRSVDAARVPDDAQELAAAMINKTTLITAMAGCSRKKEPSAEMPVAWNTRSSAWWRGGRLPS